jgi:hypothetical protein
VNAYAKYDFIKRTDQYGLPIFDKSLDARAPQRSAMRNSISQENEGESAKSDYNFIKTRQTRLPEQTVKAQDRQDKQMGSFRRVSDSSSPSLKPNGSVNMPLKVFAASRDRKFNNKERKNERNWYEQQISNH